ncbi:MAG: PIG-L deacetylase family protein [Planctomycetota bacterium]
MKPPLEIQPPAGSVLVVAPHPDDESCGIGGTLALHRRRGDPVHVCFLTDGTGGDPEGRHGEDLVRIRRAEARNAAEILGGLTLEFLGLPDGHEANSDDLRMVAEMLDRAITARVPDLVYVPWQEEAHIDHANACRALRLCLDSRQENADKKRVRVLEYEVWSPLPADYVIDITETVEQKRLAMLAHASQVAYTEYPHQLLGLAAHRSVYLPKNSRYGEAFREGHASREHGADQGSSSR